MLRVAYPFQLICSGREMPCMTSLTSSLFGERSLNYGWSMLPRYKESLDHITGPKLISELAVLGRLRYLVVRPLSVHVSLGSDLCNPAIAPRTPLPGHCDHAKI